MARSQTQSAVMDDLDDLIGTTTSPKKRPSVSLKRADRKVEEIFVTRTKTKSADGKLEFDVGSVCAGVTVTWMASVFHMGTQTVQRRLATCPVMGERSGRKYYDLRDAISYLAKPKPEQFEDLIKGMSPQDLPVMLQKAYWDGKTQRQRFELAARELWRTDDVLNVLGEVFKRLKTTIQLVPDNMQRTHGLTDVQFEALRQALDSMQNDMYQQLVEMPKAQRTPSSVVEGLSEDVNGTEDDLI